MSAEVEPALIDGKARTVRELMQSQRYGLDFYQREFSWTEANVIELLNDLSDAFLQEYEPHHERVAVASYRPYFLGTVVTSTRGDVRFLVDGQQRLTTLSLLLMHLQALAADRPGAADLSPLVFSERYGVRSFNLDVRERNAVMMCILNGTDYDPSTGDASSRNIWQRYSDIVRFFPAEIAEGPLLHFTDWLLERVLLTEIVATDDEMAVEIFETMNDRGLQLSSADMLKSFLITRVGEAGNVDATNRLWRDRMDELKALDHTQTPTSSRCGCAASTHAPSANAEHTVCWVISTRSGRPSTNGFRTTERRSAWTSRPTTTGSLTRSSKSSAAAS